MTIGRRSFVHLLGAEAVAPLPVEFMVPQPQPVSAVSAVDHLLLGAADLDAAIAWFEEKSGVRAVIGGSHPGVGTRNALAALGGQRYLEIIAPDPAQADYKSRFDVRSLSTPRLITWAAATPDMDALATRARDAGLTVTGPNGGSRARPDGKLLKWRTLGVQTRFARGEFDPVPFFIQWDAGSVHPSADSPRGCELRAFEGAHPEAAAVAATLRRLGIELRVSAAADVRLIAILDTPKGRVELF